MVALRVSTQVLAKDFTRSSCDEVTELTFPPAVVISVFIRVTQSENILDFPCSPHLNSLTLQKPERYTAILLLIARNKNFTFMFYILP